MVLMSVHVIKKNSTMMIYLILNMILFTTFEMLLVYCST